MGYGPYRYKYASSREGDWFVVCLASQKNYISLYICACDDNGYLVENNKERLGQARFQTLPEGMVTLHPGGRTVPGELV